MPSSFQREKKKKVQLQEAYSAALNKQVKKEV